jgi:hypothetical protein
MKALGGRLIVLLVLVTTAGVALAFTSDERTAGAIDLTGEWTVAVSGDVALTCTVIAEQSGTDVDAQLRCAGAPAVNPFTGATPLEGTFDPQTRLLELDLDGETGLDIELEGTVSVDGEKVEGTWEWSGGRLNGTFHAVRGIDPPTIPELDGAWTIYLEDERCSADLEQDVTTVQLDLACPGDPPAMLAGSIDRGLLTLVGGGFYLFTAEVTQDGIALSGSSYRNTPGGEYGSLTGLRNVERTFDGDATGDWRATMFGGTVGCDVAVEQSGADIFAAFDCGSSGGWWLRGQVDAASGTFELEGVVDSNRDDLAAVRGVMSEDGRSFVGTVLVVPGNYSFATTVAGTQIDSSPSFLDVTGDYTAQLISQLGERVVCVIHLDQSQEIAIAPATCEGVGQGTFEGWISPLAGRVWLKATFGTTTVWLSGEVTSEAGRQVIAGSWVTNLHFVSGCFTTDDSVDCEQGGDVVPGDATFDDLTNSLDAAVVLQVSAGLVGINDLCNEGEGVYILRRDCCPVVISALDAAIILQIDAGLFGRLVG